MQHTPWTRSQPQSSFPSDRLTPRSQGNSSGKGKGGGSTAGPVIPKSRKVRTLEKLLKDVRQNALEKDPKGGCFCQGRQHQVSSFVPFCPGCSLIKCSLNLPTHLCPSCSAEPFDALSKDDMVAKLEAELTSTLDAEERQRETEIEEKRKLMGAFPSLSQSQASSPLDFITQMQPQQTHKVLSLASSHKNKAKKGKVTVTSYSHSPSPTESRAGSRPPSPGELKEMEQEKTRIGKPTNPRGKNPPEGRSWKNSLRGEEVTYIPPKDARVSGKRRGP